jgi:3-mercaptopyruvate sulfurtransferase SseA
VEVTLDELLARREDVTLLDVRSEAEYTGRRGYPCDPRQGHIPGARHVDVQQIVESSPAELRALIGLPEEAEIVCYCHSGSRSATAATALRAAGYDASNYAGSWHEWSRRDDLPAEQS